MERCILSGHELVKPGKRCTAGPGSKGEGRTLSIKYFNIFQLSQGSTRERLSPPFRMGPERPGVLDAKQGQFRIGAPKEEAGDGKVINHHVPRGWQRAPAPAPTGPPARALTSDRPIGLLDNQQ